jgi:ABC-type transporter Mla MlaB component
MPKKSPQPGRGLTDAGRMSVREATVPVLSPRLEITLIGGSDGCTARISGEVIAETTVALGSIESMLVNEAHVILDFSGITSIDDAGLLAVVRVIDAVLAFGGRLTIGEHLAARPDGGIDVVNAVGGAMHIR